MEKLKKTILGKPIFKKLPGHGMPPWASIKKRSLAVSADSAVAVIAAFAAVSSGAVSSGAVSSGGFHFCPSFKHSSGSPRGVVGL